MSDHNYLCRLYGVDPAQSDELIEKILEEDEKYMRAEQEQIFLDVGRLVHLVWLTSETPAKVIKVEFNKVLEEPLEFTGFNHLTSMGRKDPGRWFLEKELGFKVRSKKVNGLWLQCVFGGGNLVRSEMIEYLRNCTELNFDECKIDPECYQTIGTI